MNDKEKKRLHKQRKRRIKELYRLINEKAYNEINNSLNKECGFYIKTEYQFITWLVMKKLERKGYKCKLEKQWLNDFNDYLYIRW